jgi:hypothetical protein
MADNASAKNARKLMLMAAAELSVNMLSAPSLIRFVKGTAADAADIKRYAIICKKDKTNWSKILEKKMDPEKETSWSQIDRRNDFEKKNHFDNEMRFPLDSPNIIQFPRKLF